MKEMKRTHVPVPGAQPKAKPKDTPAKAQLSQEFVGSDDDSPAEKAPAAKSKTTMAVHKPNGTVRAKEKSSAKQSAKTKSAATAKPAPRKPAPKQIVTQEQAAELSSSEVTDDEDVPARDMETELPGGKGRASESDSGSASDSSSDESDVDGTSQPAAKPAQAYDTCYQLCGTNTDSGTGKRDHRRHNRMPSSSAQLRPTYHPKASVPCPAMTRPQLSLHTYLRTSTESKYGTSPRLWVCH
jgi:hypothetical protein